MPELRSVTFDGLPQPVAILELSAAERRTLTARRSDGPPYWSCLWPGGVALARHLVERHARHGLRGRHVLDLGCGLGLAGIACALLGARVTFVDNVGEALALVETNCRLNGIAGHRTLRSSWSAAGVRTLRCDLVLGGDILYERDQWRPIRATLARVLAQDGHALFVESHGLDEARLSALFDRHSLRLATTTAEARWPPWGDQSKVTRRMAVYRIGRAARRTDGTQT